ncbi:MAG: alpha/beta fold hydrolase [Acidobacteriota bacterium]|nr:alpha/beta fold hydrolase [Acidobacteriota bacterium]
MLGAVIVLATAVVVVRPGIALDVWRMATLRWHGARAGTTSVRGQEIAWAELGSGPPVLLVHGLRGELTIQLPLARALAERGYRVVALDLPGHGRSSAPREPLDIASAGRIAVELSRELGMERPVLVGHSLGGWIVGWQTLSDPDAGRGAVLISTAGLPFELPRLSLLLSRTAGDARRSVRLLFAEPPRIVPLPVLWFAVQRPHAASLDLLRSAVSGRYLLDGLVSASAVPTLVVFGEQDRLVPPEVGREIATSHRDARFAGIEGAGHMVVWEKPAEVAEAIDAFILGLPATRPVDGEDAAPRSAPPGS